MAFIRSNYTFFSAQPSAPAQRPAAVLRCVKWIGCAVSLMGLMSLVFAWQKPVRVKAKFAVKTIDALGHPIAGAEIYFFGTLLGLTDSFGEWQRDMSVELSEAQILQLSVRKKNPRNGESLAKIAFSIPSNLGSNAKVNFRKTIQLRSTH